MLQICCRVFEIVSETRNRDDNSIVNYVSDTEATPEEQLVTEVLIATVRMTTVQREHL